jgi:RNA polymerase sigma factor (sigma-70 family)
MVLIRKYQESGAIGNFWPLAREVARRQSLAAFRKQKRGVVLLSEESLDRIDRGFDDVVAETENREQALVRCLEHLPFGWRDLVSLKYWDNLPILDIARRLGKSTNTVSVTLNRIRGKLADCIQAQIRAESQG